MTENNSQTEQELLLEEIETMHKMANGQELDDFTYPLLRDVVIDDKGRETLDDLVLGMQDPDLFTSHGIEPMRVVLFVGDTGVGKNHSIKAVRNETMLQKPVMYFIYDKLCIEYIISILGSVKQSPYPGIFIQSFAIGKLLHEIVKGIFIANTHQRRTNQTMWNIESTSNR